MGTKNDPGEFDCYANAEPDEPMFVLLARDPTAPLLVRTWVELQGMAVSIDKASEAYACANKMEAWRKANRPG